MEVQGLTWEARAAAHTAALLSGLRCLPEEEYIDEPPPDCDECSGTGEARCQRCKGEGEVECACPNCSDDHTRPCRVCDGTGDAGACETCKGSGSATGLAPLLLPHPADEWTIPSLLPLSLNGSFT